ncbi:MAG TPA: hypothetical protein VFU05_02220 [Cyclobacteriaceae bacterium]|nr:hypothetical protein [Cyclobacteriaceae bacterium]
MECPCFIVILADALFTGISWQEFLSAIGVIVGGYYAITTLLLYSEEIKSIFNQSQRKVIEADAHDDQNDSNESIDLMGSVKYETAVNVPHEKVVDSEEINAQPLTEIEDAIDDVIVNTPDVLIAKSVAELLREIKTIITELSQGSREEIASIYCSLLQHYPQLTGTTYQDEISQFIHDSLSTNTSHAFTLNEIKSWWAEDNT